MPNWKAPRLNGCDVWAAIEGTSYHRHFTVFQVFPPHSPFFSPFYQPTSPLSQASVSVTAPSSLQHSNGTWIKSYEALVPNPSSHNLPRQERLLWFCWGVGWLTGVRVGWKVWGDGYIMKYKGETGGFWLHQRGCKQNTCASTSKHLESTKKCWNSNNNHLTNLQSPETKVINLKQSNHHESGWLSSIRRCIPVLEVAKSMLLMWVLGCY